MSENPHQNNPLEKEAITLQNEVLADAEAQGPMKQIVEAQRAIFNSAEFRNSPSNLDSPALIGQEEFVYKDKKYRLAISVFSQDDKLNVRVSILSYDQPIEPIHNLNNDLALLDNEMAFRQYSFEQYGDSVIMSGAVSSSPSSEKGFAKSLILSTSLVARQVMKVFQFPVVEASIGDVSESVWSGKMAERLGYQKSTDFEDLYMYTYRSK